MPTPNTPMVDAWEHPYAFAQQLNTHYAESNTPTAHTTDRSNR